MTNIAGGLRVLVVHNRYQQAGGEDSVFENEVALLRAGGCAVDTLVVSNDIIQGVAAQVSAALRIIANPAGRKAMAAALTRFTPDVVHVHNFFPQLSPAIFDTCVSAGVPVVWTLHNFRVACANGLLFRDGRPCEDCIGQLPLPAVLHRCYRGSRAGSAAVAAMIAYHNAAGTWQHKVSAFVALTDFARDLLVRAGLPRERIVVKPNFVIDPGHQGGPVDMLRRGAVFVGRLSPEKGVQTLVDAWRKLPQIPLTIVGDGPERTRLEADAPPHVHFAGLQSRTAVLPLIAQAQAMVVPSTWYENFPMVVVEAMALGTPVIASRIGALESIVTDGVNGLHFVAGDSDSLSHVAGKAFTDSARLARLGASARATWQEQMSPEHSLKALLALYTGVIAKQGATPPRAGAVA